MMFRWKSAKILCIPLLFPFPLFAQTSVDGAQPAEEARGALVRDLSFSGVDGLSESALRQVVATSETRCRGLLLTPFCWFTDWDVIVERHRLDPDELPRDELRLLVHYFREGFREAGAISEVRDRDDGVEVVMSVEEGPTTLIESLEISQTVDVLSSADLDRAAIPAEGDRLSLNRIDDALAVLAERLEERGFFDAEVYDSVQVQPEGARLQIHVDPGPRSTVARFEVEGNQGVDDETIIQALHLNEGEVLTTPLIRESRRALHQSNLFHEVDVEVPEQPDSSKVVVVRVREAPPRLARLGGGLNTLEFGQAEARFTHYNWMGGGRRIDLRAAVGNLFARQLNDQFLFQDILPGELTGVDQRPFERPTWSVTAEFNQPAFRAAENLLGVGAFMHRQVIPGVSVDRGFGGEVSLTRRLAFQSSLSLTYRYERIAVEAGEVYFCVTFGICDLTAIQSLRGHNTLSPVTLGLLIDRSDDPLGPTRGYRLRVELEHASGPTISDFRYHRISGEASYYVPFGPEQTHVVATRVRAGWVDPLESTIDALGLDEGGRALLHPRKRFFAGGSRSVRGFPENQLGPQILTIAREELLAAGCTPEEISARTCDPAVVPTGAFAPRAVGGTAILEGSVELRVPMGNVLFAAFLDGALVGGRVDGFLQDAARALTPGIGARFSSPAGPIRIDLGLYPSLVRNLPVVTESEPEVVNDIVDRQLIELEQLRRFDPLEAEGTLGRWLRRLTLHFSIGEAF